MSLVKNTYGVSVVLRPRNSNYDKMGSLAGSCLNRVDAVKKIKAQVDLMNLAIIKKKIVKDKEKIIKPRTMSQRTKSKIRKKIISFKNPDFNLGFCLILIEVIIY